MAYNLPPVTKVMLTCFVSNTAALDFYRARGFSTDDMSPTARVLRGKTVLPDYAILITLRQTGMPAADYGALLTRLAGRWSTTCTQTTAERDPRCRSTTAVPTAPSTDYNESIKQ